MQAGDSGSTSGTTRMLLVVSGCFLLTTVPFGIYVNGMVNWPISSPDPYTKAKSQMAYAILYELFCLNSAINFLLYMAFGKAYRVTLVRMVCCRDEEKKVSTKMSNLGPIEKNSKTNSTT